MTWTSGELEGGLGDTARGGVASARPRIFARQPDWHFSLMLGLELVFLFVALPALAAGEADRNLVTLLQLTLVSIAIGLIARSTWLRCLLTASFGLPLLARLMPGLLPHALTLSMVFVYNLILTAAVARAVFGPGEVNNHRIAGAIFVYLNIALLFALCFAGLLMVVPDALTGLPAGASNGAFSVLHFSMTTLTTIGDGNITPRSQAARSLADLETIIGQLFPAVLLSRLVGLRLSRGT